MSAIDPTDAEHGDELRATTVGAEIDTARLAEALADGAAGPAAGVEPAAAPEPEAAAEPEVDPHANPPIITGGELLALAEGRHGGPHGVLCQHRWGASGEHLVYRVRRPLAKSVAVLVGDGAERVE
ncbi:MAG: hypothetical protein GXX90_09655, partial [Microbacteriaceae bacterium]|nr:hypothetical protein [Microbacteriaceae bacterium]